jgi:hypothetical protein
MPLDLKPRFNVQDNAPMARREDCRAFRRKEANHENEAIRTLEGHAELRVCGACPVVEISTEGVTIGEDDNTVRLTHAQWNDLVSRIRKGELPSVE